MNIKNQSKKSKYHVYKPPLRGIVRDGRKQGRFLIMLTYISKKDVIATLQKKWSLAGATAFADHLEAKEQKAGYSTLFNPPEYFSSYCEYETAVEAAMDYGWQPLPFEYDSSNEAAALFFLRQNTFAIDFVGGVIVRHFELNA